MQVENFESLMKKLDEHRLISDTKDRRSVVVGYTQNYAVFVHENLNYRHKHGKVAKFLEAPARQLAREVPKIVAEVAKKGKGVGEGLLVAGLRIQRESQKIVPIDTSALKASAFTCFEEDLPVAVRSSEGRAKAAELKRKIKVNTAIGKVKRTGKIKEVSQKAKDAKTNAFTWTSYSTD